MDTSSEATTSAYDPCCSMKPNFFIIGAPRCGTTALSRYLAKHPKICFSIPKEPHYFTGPAARMDKSSSAMFSEYMDRHFPHLEPGYQAVGEGSVSYLYAPSAIQRILEFNPAAKFIVMVRNPLDMLPSYHARLLFTMDEDVPDFATAWGLQGERAGGRKVPRLCRDPRFLQYAEVARFGKYLEQVYTLGGRERCLVIVVDDFVDNPRDVYCRALTFLGVNDDGRKSFPPRQPSKAYRFQWLQRLLARPPASFMEQALVSTKQKERGKDRSTKKSFVTRMHKRLSSFNTVKRKPVPLVPHIRGLLRETLSEDTEQLGRLIDRDLSHWLR